MDTQSLDKFKTICGGIHAAIPDSNGRQWDDRFNTALISFEAGGSEKIMAAVKSGFAHQWDKSTIGKAPNAVNKLVKSTFNINAGQLIFTSDENQGIILLAAWWPWGNGATISLRVGIFAVGKEKISEEETKALLQTWFAVA